MSKNFVSYQDANALMTAIGNKFKAAVTAANVSYDNTNSGLEATNVQDAIDEICNNPPGPDIPDGKTVIPINDVVIWQKCAGIENGYSTLSEILADSGILAILMADSNAVDYLARCKKFIDKSGLIPIMTSDTEPSGEASAINVSDGNHKAWCAFNGNNDRFWMPSYDNPQNPWVQYAFSDSVEASKATLIMTADSQGGTPQTIAVIIQGSNDGTNFINISSSVSISGTTSPATYNIDLIAGAKYRYYRAQFTGYMVEKANINRRVTQFQIYSPTITDNQSAMSYIGLNNYAANKLISDIDWLTAIAKSSFKTSVLNVKTPTMTDNTHPSGTCSASAANPSYAAYCAFDGNVNSAWSAYSGSAIQWLQYEFPNSVRIVLMEKLYNGVEHFSFTLKGSNDNTDFTDLVSGNADEANTQQYIFLNPDSYKQYRAVCTATAGSVPYVHELCLYGRQDV